MSYYCPLTVCPPFWIFFFFFLGPEAFFSPPFPLSLFSQGWPQPRMELLFQILFWFKREWFSTGVTKPVLPPPSRILFFLPAVPKAPPFGWTFWPARGSAFFSFTGLPFLKPSLLSTHGRFKLEALSRENFMSVGVEFPYLSPLLLMSRGRYSASPPPNQRWFLPSLFYKQRSP